MPYLVQKESGENQWETLFSEEEALKADLLMEGLTYTSGNRKFEGFSGRTPFYAIYRSGYRVAWREPQPPSSTDTE